WPRCAGTASRPVAGPGARRTRRRSRPPSASSTSTRAVRGTPPRGCGTTGSSIPPTPAGCWGWPFPPPSTPRSSRRASAYSACRAARKSLSDFGFSEPCHRRVKAWACYGRPPPPCPPPVPRNDRAMSIFPQGSAKKDSSLPFGKDAAPPAREPSPAAAAFEPADVPLQPARPAAAAAPQARESVIASDLTIEGKISGSGHVRIAGRFKGDVNVEGDLTIDGGARLNGGVRAKRVTVAGELEGNIESA